MKKIFLLGWVNITRMVGQHKSEWWVNMFQNIHEWLKYVFETIMDTIVTELHKLYPQNFKESKN